MKPGLQVGHRAQLNRYVDSSQSITIGSKPATPVFATPSMIHLMEYTASDVLRPFLEADEDSVGVDVHIEHTAATPLGAEVNAIATVIAINKNVISFSVEAFDNQGKIGAGTHRRAVIKTEKFAQRLARSSQTQPSEELNFDSFQRLKVDWSGAVLRVTLDRANKRNAIDSLMTSELEQLTEWLSASDICIVQFQGDSAAFSAGDDVLELETLGIEGAVQLSRRRSFLYQRWQTLPQILIASIEGKAFGGGFVLAAACDFRLASHSAIFGLPEIKLGWLPNYGLARVATLIGHVKAAELSLTGRSLNARQAHQIGFVNEVVPAGRLHEEVEKLTNHLLTLSATGLAETKGVLNSMSAAAHSETIAADAFRRCLMSEEARRGIAAFKDKS